MPLNVYITVVPSGIMHDFILFTSNNVGVGNAMHPLFTLLLVPGKGELRKHRDKMKWVECEHFRVAQGEGWDGLG